MAVSPNEYRKKKGIEKDEDGNRSYRYKQEKWRFCSHEEVWEYQY